MTWERGHNRQRLEPIIVEEKVFKMSLADLVEEEFKDQEQTRSARRWVWDKQYNCDNPFQHLL